MEFIGPDFITLFKLVPKEQDIVAMREWKKKCVGLFYSVYVPYFTLRLNCGVGGYRGNY